MVIYAIKYNGKEEYATIYDTWDVDQKHCVVSCIKNVMFDDVGKFLKLNDGSKQYVKILKIWKDRIDTSSGLYYKWETICCVNPRIPFTEYCGARKGEESLAVIEPKAEELDLALQLYRDKKCDGKVTMRIKAMANDMVMQRMLMKGHDANSVIDKVIDLAMSPRPNQHTFNALKALGKAMDIDMLDDRPKETMNISLASRFGLGSIRDTRMLDQAEKAEIVG